MRRRGLLPSPCRKRGTMSAHLSQITVDFQAPASREGISFEVFSYTVIPSLLTTRAFHVITILDRAPAVEAILCQYRECQISLRCCPLARRRTRIRNMTRSVSCGAAEVLLAHSSFAASCRRNCRRHPKYLTSVHGHRRLSHRDSSIVGSPLITQSAVPSLAVSLDCANAFKLTSSRANAVQ